MICVVVGDVLVVVDNELVDDVVAAVMLKKCDVFPVLASLPTSPSQKKKTGEVSRSAPYVLTSHE